MASGVAQPSGKPAEHEGHPYDFMREILARTGSAAVVVDGGMVEDMLRVGNVQLQYCIN